MVIKKTILGFFLICFATLPLTASAAVDFSHRSLSLVNSKELKSELNLNSLILKNAKAEDLDTNSLLDLLSTEGEDNTLMFLLLIILFLLEYYEGNLGGQQTCTEQGGDWVNEGCVNEDKDQCVDSGGTWMKFNNDCLADKAKCSGDDGTCGENFNPVWSCSCSDDKCYEDGMCIDKENSRKEACEDTEGTWKEFNSVTTLCLERCSSTSSQCSSNPEGILGENYPLDDMKGCDCPTDKCLSAAGECIDDTEGDDDEDGVKNKDDRCPDTPYGEQVNTQIGSQDAGCSCSQLEANGRVNKNRQCPADQCECSGTGSSVEGYWVDYPDSGSDTCSAGIITEYSCSPLSRQPKQECRDMCKRQDEANNGGQNGNQGGNQNGNQGNQDPGQNPGQNPGGTPSPGTPSPGTPTPGSSEKAPKKLEPNMFKKVCGENKYVLWNSGFGKGGEDLNKLVGDKKLQWYKTPTCEELAKCHCCCNTCTVGPPPGCPDGWCFSIKTICDDKKDCTSNCSTKCDDNCKKGCEKYSEPTHKKIFDRDCDCKKEGCDPPPSKDDENCVIVLFTASTEWTYRKDKKEHKKFGGEVENTKDLVFRFIPKDVATLFGTIESLKDEPGKCCKCVDQGEATKGPGGSLGNQGANNTTSNQGAGYIDTGDESDYLTESSWTGFKNGIIKWINEQLPNTSPPQLFETP